jgi:hypothetical protein
MNRAEHNLSALACRDAIARAPSSNPGNPGKPAPRLTPASHDLTVVADATHQSQTCDGARPAAVRTRLDDPLCAA